MRVFPLAYWGSLAYYQELCKHEEVIVETKEHFVKQTGRNRCEILGSNGLLSLSIPIKREHGEKTPMDEILLADKENWRARHWRAIMSAYQSAPFFDYYGMEVEELIFAETNNLVELNKKIMERIISWLDLSVKINYSEEFIPAQENDFRAFLVNKNYGNEFQKSPYIQVFPGDKSFVPAISILDAIMCTGPLTRNLLLPTQIN